MIDPLRGLDLLRAQAQQGVPHTQPCTTNFTTWKISPRSYQEHISSGPTLATLRGLLVERQQNTTRSILGLERYNHTALEAFLHAEQQEIYRQWEDYNKRRASGQSPELSNDKESAKKWLKRNAPLKLVDGSWLGHVRTIPVLISLIRYRILAWRSTSFRDLTHYKEGI